MIVEAFQLRSFRSFVESTEIQLRPLTLLFGYNSAGKSVLLRAFPLIAASLRSTEGAPIALGAAVARRASFQDILPHPSLSAARQLSLGLRFRHDKRLPQKQALVTWDIRDLPELRQQMVETFRLEVEGEMSLHASWNLEPPNQVRRANRYVLDGKGEPKRQIELLFNGLMPDVPPTDVESGRVTTQFQRLKDRLLDPAANVQWLASVRCTPDRLLPWRNPPPAVLEADGAGAADVLAYDDLEKGPLLNEVSAWYEKNLGWRLRVAPIENQYRLLLEPVGHSPVQVSITDVGEGLVQALPVLVAGARLRAASANAPRILAVEEPESHLHPRLHAALAEWFCELAAWPDPPQLLLETHSENTLLRVQRAVAEGSLDPARVMVYWVRQTGDGASRAEPVEFDSLGRPQGNWPPGVFTEDLEQARRLVKARQQRVRE